MTTRPTLWPQSLRRVTSPGSYVTRVTTLCVRCCGTAVDSQCTGCQNWKWARRNECNKCGAKHPTRAPLPPSTRGPSAPSPTPASPHRSNAYPRDAATGKVDQKLNHSVGLDTKSYSTAGRDMKRTGEAGGFREFDDEEEARRKRRAHEVAQEVAERKAEKKKCEFCKRFSCIC